MKIELTREQEQEVMNGGSVEVVDPMSAQGFVVLAREQYKHVKSLLKDAPVSEITSREADNMTRVPAGILRSQEAYWRDLPELLKLRTVQRQWVAYSGNERIGFGRTCAEVYEICERRGLATNQIYADRLEPRPSPPWEPEIIEAHFDTEEPTGPAHDDHPQ